jgi:Holliday junction resolvase RusA-like endonuclease
MSGIAFIVPAVPVAQPRQRHRVVPSGGRPFVQNFTPAKHPVQAFKASVRLAARDAYQGPPLDGPVGIVVVFAMPRPGRLMWKKRPMPRCLHVSKPDLDNLAKAVKDALTGLLWRDDAQIAHANLSKVYASGEEQPSVRIEVSSLADSQSSYDAALEKAVADGDTFAAGRSLLDELARSEEPF